MILKRSLMLVLGAVLAAGSAWAEVPTADQGFLDRHLPGIRALADSLGTAPLSQESAVDGIRKVSTLRREALREFHGTVAPLTSLTGIETQDHLDLEAIRAMGRILGGMVGPADPSPEQGMLFQSAMASIPPLETVALPFMSLAYIDHALAAADSLVAERAMSPAQATEAVLPALGDAVEKSLIATRDALGEASIQDLRHSSIVMRLRCPRDEGTYRLNHMKNQIRDGGDISRLYYLQCNLCAEPMLLEFPLDLLTRLNRMAERQEFAEPPDPPRSYSVEP